MKTKILIFILLSFISTSLRGQFSDDFSDGDFTQNPTWGGDTSQFIVNVQRALQLNAAEGGKAHLSALYSPTGEELEWHFDIRLAFSPSGNNYARIYLISDTCNLLSSSLRGYYLQFGEAGSNDVVELFRQDNGEQTSILRGSTSIASSFSYKIKVFKRANHEWELLIDSAGSGIYTHNGSGIDSCEDIDTAYLGIFCEYTSGNRNKFYFDNIYCGPPIIDTSPPYIIDLQYDIDTPDQVTIWYSEPVTEESALETAHYRLEGSESHPAVCEFGDVGQTVVRLYFADTLRERTDYRLITGPIRDFSGNEMEEDTNRIWLYRLRRGEVVISEIMADPTPSIRLPDYEYIELHNTQTFPIRLRGWKIQIGGTQRTLPEIEMEAGEDIVLTSASGAEELSRYGRAYALTSLAITDEGQALTLYDAGGEVIHHVAFKRRWHRNALKREGGWSLEMIDDDNYCEGEGNWDSSISADGGTPCRTNSIARENRDLQSPHLEKVTVQDSLHLTAFFSESMEGALNLADFTIDHNIEVARLIAIPPDYRCVQMELREPLRRRTTYQLTVEGELCDCAGNPISSSSILFGIAEKPTVRNLIINEVLSNPFEDTDADYIEFYNPSAEFVDLGEVLIGSGCAETPEKVVPLVESGWQLAPGDYAAVCKNKQLTLQQYFAIDESKLIENEGLPALPNDAGCIHILDKELRRIDLFSYEKTMHYALLTSTDGVSLERLHTDGNTQDATNWTSAAEGWGWGTPGIRNSQASAHQSGEEAITIEPAIISPDGDGHDDYAEILCSFSSNNCRISLTIFDGNGRQVARIADNQPCGTEDRFRWDGLTADGRASPNGLYVLQAIVWDLDGRRSAVRRAIGIVRRE